MLQFTTDLFFAMFFGLANNILDGDEHEQIKILYKHRLELMRTRLGPAIKFKCSKGIFEGMYVSLSPLKAGFLVGYRLVILVNGCFFKGLFWDQLLSVVGVDADDCIYPFVWVVVDIGNHYNWRWFLELLLQTWKSTTIIIGLLRVIDRRFAFLTLFSKLIQYRV